MAIDDKTIGEKLQCDINREAAKVSALSSGKIDKYEYRTAKEILLSYQSNIIEQAKVTNFALRKPLEKRTRITEDYCQKSKKAIKNRLKKEPKTKQTNKQTNSQAQIKNQSPVCFQKTFYLKRLNMN